MPQSLEATVRETVSALRRRGSDFTEKLAEVLVNAQGSGFYMAHAIIDLAALADSGNVRRLKAAFQGGRCNLLDLSNVPASERVLVVLHTFVEVIDEQRALADLPPLDGKPLDTGINQMHYDLDQARIAAGAKVCGNGHPTSSDDTVRCIRPQEHEGAHGAWSPLMTAYWRW